MTGRRARGQKVNVSLLTDFVARIDARSRVQGAKSFREKDKRDQIVIVLWFIGVTENRRDVPLELLKERFSELGIFWPSRSGEGTALNKLIKEGDLKLLDRVHRAVYRLTPKAEQTFNERYLPRLNSVAADHGLREFTARDEG